MPGFFVGFREDHVCLAENPWRSGIIDGFPSLIAHLGRSSG